MDATQTQDQTQDQTPVMAEALAEVEAQDQARTFFSVVVVQDPDLSVGYRSTNLLMSVIQAPPGASLERCVAETLAGAMGKVGPSGQPAEIVNFGFLEIPNGTMPEQVLTRGAFPLGSNANPDEGIDQGFEDEYPEIWAEAQEIAAQMHDPFGLQGLMDLLAGLGAEIFAVDEDGNEVDLDDTRPF